MTKKITKALALTVCAVLLVCGSVLGTMAYLTSTDTVSNTFTVGNVKITLDELDTDVYGAAASGAPRVESNEYKLIPGHTYTKEATVHVSKESEACYLFVKLDGVFADDHTTAVDASEVKTTKVTFATGWTSLGDSVYYYNVNGVDNDNNGTVVDARTAGIDILVIDKFTVAGEIESITNTADSKITAYAVQADGFADAETAWKATFGKTN